MTGSKRVLLAGVVVLGLAGAIAGQPLSGPYIVGPGGAYANLAAAIAALTTNGVSGPVTFTVAANDVGPWTLAAIPGQGPANPITFSGQGAVTLSGTQPLLTLNGCANVTFSGFTATFVATAIGIAINAGTTSCVFSGCTLTGPAATSGSAVFSLAGGTGCRIEDSTFGGSYQALDAGTGNDSTTVQRCRIIGGGFRIMTIGGTNFTLRNNFITGNSNYGINAGAPGTPTSANNLRIQHNSVYIAHPTAGSQYCSLRWYSGAA